MAQRDGYILRVTAIALLPPLMDVSTRCMTFASVFLLKSDRGS